MLIYLQMIETPEERYRFEQLYYKYRSLMFHVANQVLNNESDAEDAVHHAFMAIIDHFEKISEIDCPKTRGFVVTIVERKAIDIYRSKNRKNALPFEEYINVPSEDLIHSAVEGSEISAAIASLPTKYRELIMLKYDSGYSDKEIAAMMKMSVENVGRTIRRAKAKLYSILNPE